jgi:replicative DNA helicase
MPNFEGIFAVRKATIIMALPNLNTRSTTRKKTSSVDVSAMMYGKIPPQARELEEAILGGILLEKSAFDTVTEILKPECFYVEAHQMIFQSMQSLQQKNMPIDMLTVVEELKMREYLDQVGGAYYISKLTNVVVSTANIDAHSKIVLQKFIQRELIRISGEIISNSYEDSTDVFDLLDESETKMFNITNNYLKKNFVDIGNALAESIKRIDVLRTKKDEISGVPSG